MKSSIDPSRHNPILSTSDRSILTKAFRGELVPQDPNNEPAAVLLERIRAERAGTQRSRSDQTSTPKQRGKATRKNNSKQLSVDRKLFSVNGTMRVSEFH